MAISSSGLEAEIQKRIADWAAKGVTPEVTTGAAVSDGTKTVTVEVGGQTIDITITVRGSGGTAGGPGLTGDLAKDLQAAYAGDTVLSGDKAKFKDSLAAMLTSLAAKFKSNEELRLGLDPITTKEGLERMIRADLLKFVGGTNLPQTQAVIRKHLTPLLTNGATKLTPQFRTQIAAELEKIAAVLSALK